MTEQPSSTNVTRRVAIAAGIVGAAAGAVLSAGEGTAHSGSAARAQHPAGAPGERLPVVFLPHGGGPWPFVDIGIGTKAEQAELAQYLRSIATLPKTRPKAVLVISAHWEEAVP